MPFKIIVNSKSIRDKLDRFSLPKATNVGREKAKIIIKNKREKFLDEFESHDISAEIKAGAGSNFKVDGQNGNLFSFIGFDDGSDPIGDLKYYFENVIKIANNKPVYNRSNKTLIFKMRLPTEEGIKKVTDLSQYTKNNNYSNWGAGLSWVSMIERGIPGLSRYKFSNNPSVLGAKSRSGTGLQRKNEIHPGAEYKPREYLTELLKVLTTR